MNYEHHDEDISVMKSITKAKKMKKKTIYTLYDLVTEMESFLPVSKNELSMAKNSPITTANNRDFAYQVKLWGMGIYDECPEQFLYTIVNIGRTYFTLRGVERPV